MFFKEKKEVNDSEDLIMIAALLIHAAKIDENYTNQEEEIIKRTILEIGVNEFDIEKIMENAKKIEKNNNQILDYTKRVKKMNDDYKIRIVEALWKIIYSNKEADIYETNLMRRLTGLLYIDSKTMGDIKEKIKKINS
jgi:uncharacterized tellurite resistance protein B-like protein|tara:strand:+ start:289 stop:702 length:414 start_codon:yes stop_codon:yes gene_type:complete